jgi:hypothetical protein
MVLSSLLAAAAAATVTAGTAASPHYRAVKVPEAPHLDGRLDDDAWKRAPASSFFTQKTPDEGSAPTESTEIRVVYDEDSLYVAVDCSQTRSPMLAQLTRRDREVEGDGIAIDLDTHADGKSAFEFAVSEAGVLVDSIRFNDTDISSDWDENWDARVQTREGGWSAELRIPFRILRFASKDVQSWGLEARRYISARRELDEWAYFPQSAGGEVSHYGRLDDLRDLVARTPLELRPFVVGQVRRRDVSTTQLASGTDASFTGGLDLKWHPSQSLTLDATFNPDFAQVEADQLVLNLTTYETYYPEKRPFFLEGLDIFHTPFQLLYTRRIGRVADVPLLRTGAPYDEQLVDVPQPTTIYGASKLTGSLGGRWSIGTLQAVTARNDVPVQLGDGTRVRRLVDPLSSYDVVRVKRDLGHNADIGAMVTAVTHAEATSDYPPLAATSGQHAQQFCPSGVQQNAPSRCFDDAYTGAIDWRWRSANGDYTTGGQLVATTLGRGPARPVPDGTVNEPGQLGYGMQAFFNKEGGKHWVYSTSIDAETRRFDINDIGYDQRANQLSPIATLEYRDLVPGDVLREMHFDADTRQTLNVDGLLVGMGQYLETFLRFQNLWTFYGTAYFRSTKFDDREVGDGTALQRQGRFGSEVSFGSNPSKRVSFTFDQDTAKIFDGVYADGSATVTTRVLPQLDFDLGPTWLYTDGEPRFVEDGLTAGEYIFGEQKAENLGAVLRTTYTFTPRLTLQAYAQLFLASEHYHDLSHVLTSPTGDRAHVHVSDLLPYDTPLTVNPDIEQAALNVNVVLRWEYLLGSTLFLVYTRSQVPSVVLTPSESATLDFRSLGRAPAADTLFLKASFWWGT